MADLRAALRRRLVTAFGVKVPFDDATELFRESLIDSLSVMDLVSFVEEQIGCPVAATDITLENFGSVERIARFADRLAGKERPT